MSEIKNGAPASPFHSKLYIKFYVHEEATSKQTMSSDLSQISSEVTVSGHVEMQVQALNIINDTLTLKIDVCDTMFPDKMKWSPSQSVQIFGPNTICIPKTETEKVEIARFKNEFHKKSMPVIIQSQILRGDEDDSCQVVVHIKSNTNNISPLKDIVISMAVHPSMTAKSLIIEDDGSYDELRRLVTWRLKDLPVGKTHTFRIRGNLISSYASDTTKVPSFPIILKCDSKNDVIGSVKIIAECEEPMISKVTTNTFYSCRMLHRAG